jgi:hypothetical protein
MWSRLREGVAYLVESAVDEGVVDPAATAGAGDDARLAQHLEVVGEEVGRHVDRFLQVADAPATVAQLGDDLETDGVGEGSEPVE